MTFKKLKHSIEAGSRKQASEPRRLSEVLNEYFAGNSSLARAYRDRLFEDIFPHTEPCCELKLLTRKPGRLSVCGSINCMLTRDSDYHYTAVENVIVRKVTEQRNPHIYVGKRINVNRKADGTLYPTFNRPHYAPDFSFQDFCREAADELLIVAGFIKEE